MWGKLTNGTHKITAARQVLKEYVNSDFSGQLLALRVYGHNRKSDCSDTDARVFVNGKYVEGGAAKALLPGKYHVDGWRFKNKDYTYDRVEFEIQAGDEKDIFLQAL